jgi:hypothetical protein
VPREVALAFGARRTHRTGCPLLLERELRRCRGERVGLRSVARGGLLYVDGLVGRARSEFGLGLECKCADWPFRTSQRWFS